MHEERLNRLVDRLVRGEFALGLWATDRSPDGAAFYAQADIDFVVFDMEHGPFDIESARIWLQFLIDRHQIRSREPGVTPIARIPAYGYEHNYWMIKQVLDIGFLGVIVPHVSSADDVQAAVQAARYPQAKDSPIPTPRGYRGARPTMAARYWGLSQDEYVRRADLWPLNPAGEVVVIAQVETPEGIQRVGEIAGVPGLASVMVGPYDLSFAVGYPGDVQHPDVEATVERILLTCREHNIPCGIAAAPEDVVRRWAQGFRWIVTREVREVPRRITEGDPKG